ncbi:MAG: metallophosphoesterase [Candidatus Heimdallarchaeota archaeon]|nr:metallophosphoesterase [Candidatus Heimdallarchaeota archaeon]
MKIAIVGDIHGSFNNLRRLLPRIKKTKALFVTGDIANTISYPLIVKSILEGQTISREKYTDLVYGKYKEKFTEFQIKSAMKFLKLVSKLELPVFFTHGNSDAKEVREVFISQSKDNANLHYLENSIVKYDDMLIVGYGYCSPAVYRKALQTPGEKKEDEIVKDLENLESQLTNFKLKSNYTKIGLFHEPPYNTKTDYIPHSKIHGGSQSILNHINRVKYNFIFTGHVHESQGYENKNGTIMINPGALVNAQWSIADLEKGNVHLNKLFSPLSMKRLIYNSRTRFK